MFKPKLHPVLTSLALFLIISCAHTPDVLGRWREIGKTATLEFWRDGTFKAVDNLGMAVSGKYTLQKNGNIRFEITHQESPPEILNGKLTVRGDELTLTVEGHKEVERYKRGK